jgi:hypothetical protein
MSDLPEWQKADAAQLAEALTRRGAEQIQFKPLGKAVLVEMRSPSSLITLAGDSGKRAFVLDTGPKVEGLALGDEVGLHPDRRYLKLEVVFGDPGKDKFLCSDYETDIIVVVKRG